MGTLLNVFSWINTELLEILDTNKDGKVSALEVEVACYDCLLCNKGGKPCACYSTGGCSTCCEKKKKKISKVFSEIFMRIFCCGCSENQISYNSSENQTVNVDS